MSLNRRNRESGTSIGMKKTMASFQKGEPLFEKPKPGDFTIKVANTLEEREGVFRLGYKMYLQKGYIKENANQWLIQSYDSHQETAILIIQDKQKNIVGSVTLVFDGPSSLPAEKIYRDELNILRKNNEKIVEISRLVIDPQYKNSKEILVLLFNYLYIYSYMVKKYTCLAIEVNPRHIAYYQTLLDFTPIGKEKACPIVQNAPAILMYVPLKHGQEKVLAISSGKVAEKNYRSLYNYFLKPEQQALVANYLEKQVRPMNQEEKMYFGFTESGISKAVCI